MVRPVGINIAAELQTSEEYQLLSALDKELLDQKAREGYWPSNGFKYTDVNGAPTIPWRYSLAVEWSDDVVRRPLSLNQVLPPSQECDGCGCPALRTTGGELRECPLTCVLHGCWVRPDMSVGMSWADAALCKAMFSLCRGCYMRTYLIMLTSDHVVSAKPDSQSSQWFSLRRELRKALWVGENTVWAMAKEERMVHLIEYLTKKVEDQAAVIETMRRNQDDDNTDSTSERNENE